MTTIRAVAEAVAEHLASIPNCRVHAFPPDPFVPPGIVVQPPVLVWDSEDRTFCNRQFDVGLAVAVARPTEKSALDELDVLLTEIETRLGEDPSLGGVAQFSRLIDARPALIPSSGSEYPGYIVNVQVIA